MPSSRGYFLLVFGFSENQYQTESNWRKNVGLIFSGPEGNLEGSGQDLGVIRKRQAQGRAPGGALQACGPLVAPLDLISPL